MSDLRINNITDRLGQNGPVIAGVCTVTSTGAFIPPVGDTAHRGGRGRGVFAGGYDDPSPGERNVMDYITIASTGDATDFGDLTVARYNVGGFASATRGVFLGGRKETSPASNLCVIDHITISSSGGASSFGDLGIQIQTLAAASNQVRGLVAGGRGPDNSATGVNTIQFVHIATTGDSNDFGELTSPLMGVGAVASPSRVLFAGGYSTPALTNVIQYVTIATRGNTADFGDLLAATAYIRGAGNGTRGLLCGTGAPASGTNVIQYVTIATTGNATNFGDLDASRTLSSATSNSVRGVWGGGANPSRLTQIDYVTIATTGDASDFGDLTLDRSSLAACGDATGGLG